MRRIPVGAALVGTVVSATLAASVLLGTPPAQAAPPTTAAADASDRVLAARDRLDRHSAMLAGARRELLARVSVLESARAAVLLAPGAEVADADPDADADLRAEVERAETAWEQVRSTVLALEVVVALDDADVAAAQAVLSAEVTTAALPAFVVPGGGADPRALAAVQFALAQRGEPYRWGATGPDRWDCSGLVLQSYRSAGVSLPRTSRQQFLAGDRVARNDLLPGDLVFLARDPSDPATIHHVGLYVGDGLMVHAPRTGDVVRVARVPLSGFAGGVRVLDAVRGGEGGDADVPVPPAPPVPEQTEPPTDPPTRSADRPDPPDRPAHGPADGTADGAPHDGAGNRAAPGGITVTARLLLPDVRPPDLSDLGSSHDRHPPPAPAGHRHGGPS